MMSRRRQRWHKPAPEWHRFDIGSRRAPASHQRHLQQIELRGYWNSVPAFSETMHVAYVASHTLAFIRPGRLPADFALSSKRLSETNSVRRSHSRAIDLESAVFPFAQVGRFRTRPPKPRQFSKSMSLERTICATMPTTYFSARGLDFPQTTHHRPIAIALHTESTRSRVPIVPVRPTAAAMNQDPFLRAAVCEAQHQKLPRAARILLRRRHVDDRQMEPQHTSLKHFLRGVPPGGGKFLASTRVTTGCPCSPIAIASRSREDHDPKTRSWLPVIFSGRNEPQSSKPGPADIVAISNGWVKDFLSF